MRLVLDVENTTTKRDDKLHLDPFEPDNYLVQVGYLDADDPEATLSIRTLDHNESKDDIGFERLEIQWTLDNTKLLIMHNAQHDLMWLWECGYKYDGDIYDTMLGEYILDRGQRRGLSLEACAERRQLTFKKQDTLKKYFKEGKNTNEIPYEELCDYLKYDLLTTCELFHAQERDFLLPEASSLSTVKRVTFNTCKTLTEIYMAGFKVDLQELERVAKEYEHEKAEIETRLQKKVRELMGDTPINLRSPEQKSQVLFSRRVHDKKEWADLFEFTQTQEEFKDAVAANSSPIYRTTAYTCTSCEGQGKVFRTKKDGTKFARANRCKDCDAQGYKLKNREQVAGLRFTAPSKKWVSANGFNTGKDELDVLSSTAKQNRMDEAISFLSDLKRHNAISSYLSAFVNGIRTYTKDNGFLHVGLTQHITATGRFSGRNPNMQNMPRGGTFPVKKVFVSRFNNGLIMEADFAQLEFRTAAFLAQDETAMQEISTGFDVHAYTAKVITDAGQPTSRQAAKEHTFAPLFGASGYGRTKAEATYYKHFNDKYKGIANWHSNLAEEALEHMKITNISGRQYAFPDVTRRHSGVPTHFTMIKNYPVQGFATGDVVPVVLNEMHERLRHMKSCLVNTVHDSMVVDVHPDEKDLVLSMVWTMNQDLNKIIEETYGIDMNVPMLLEAKIGKNWLDTVDV